MQRQNDINPFITINEDVVENHMAEHFKIIAILLLEIKAVKPFTFYYL